MAVKIRLTRCGKKNNPEFKIVSADSRCPRDGRFIEKIGNYNPVLNDTNPRRLVINVDKLKYWMSVGAKPTDRVAKLITRSKLLE